MTTQQFTVEQSGSERRRAIGALGTIARIATGVWLLLAAFTGGGYYEGWGSGFTWPPWYEMLLGFVLLPALVMLIVIGSQRVLRTSSYLRATGSGGTLINMGIIAALFLIPFTGNIAAIFYGAPMLLAAWRGYAGCEVLAISNLVLRRDDQLGCPWFWPVDTLEERLTRRSRPDEC